MARQDGNQKIKSGLRSGDCVFATGEDLHCLRVDRLCSLPSRRLFLMILACLSTPTCDSVLEYVTVPMFILGCT